MSGHEPANGSSIFNPSHISHGRQDEPYPRDANFFTLIKKLTVKFRVLHHGLRTRQILP